MPGHRFDKKKYQGHFKGHVVTDPCPLCKAHTNQTTLTADYKNSIQYYTCEKCMKQWRK